ncbi:hypothetical protein KK120_13380 [Virgibacillus dakarensis]|uniref:hypothetical protein n=1 Tax=Virgibacillus dakarensis TaxID=1917889 RepID=UPI0013565C88|nr:hypothetical protein [Virgibacillus dakarensis]MBT2216816.1 hypothetical protein [Virgibacillus dakarensis]
MFARRFFSLWTGWAVYSIITGVLFFAGFAGIASGTDYEWINIAFSIAVVLLAWAGYQ